MAVMCCICKKMYSTRYNLNKHCMNVHNIKPEPISYAQSKWNYKCLQENCNSSFKRNSELIYHLQVVHNINILTENLEFSNLNEFQIWKASIQKCSKSNYRLSSTFKSTKGLITYYSCSRSGLYTSKANKRLPKTQRSCKLEKNCVSTIKVLHGEKIFVTWIKTHYGHSMQLQHLRLPEETRTTVASKLVIGVNPTRILDSFRDQIGEELNRTDLITRKDINNIAKSYHIDISSGVRHSNDTISVDLFVEQCKDSESNPVLFYKKQGEVDDMYNLSSSDFCLIIMTSFQKSMLKKFGHNIIAIDGTHGLNNYDFELCSVLVVDECGEGIPIAFMFSNRKDTSIYEIYFEIIKRNVNVVSPKTFMTDIVSTFYNAWVSVMGSDPQQLYCSWHVDRAWQQNLAKIKTVEKRSAVYKTLKVLQQTIEADHFVDSLSKTIKELLFDKDTYEFGIYFQNNYALNYQKWAYCFRKGCGINTNMRLESMHKVIKYFYLGGKKVKRLDKSLHVLLKYVRDKSVNVLIKNIKGKYTKHNTDIIKRHRTAMNNAFDIQAENENISSNNKTVCVERIGNDTCCDLKCGECNICYHMYTACTLEQKIEVTEPQNELPFQLEKKEKDTTSLTHRLCLKWSQIGSQLQNSNIECLNKENVEQIEHHMDAVSKLLNLKNTEHDEPANKKILKQVTFFSTKKKPATNSKIKKPTTKEYQNIADFVQNGFNEIYVSNSPINDHSYTVLKKSDE